MKKGILVMAMLLTAVAGFVLGGCATEGGAPVGTVFDGSECTIYQDVGATPENSIIAKLIENPCIAQKIICTAAKLPLVWKQEKYLELFNEWADKLQVYIESGITYSDLQQMVIVNIAKFNENVGMGLLLVSDGILVFDSETALIGDVDRTLLLMSLADLRAQVQRMAAIVS